MATTINFAGNTYAGEVLEDLLVYTAKGNDTYQSGLIHVKPGVQKRFVLPHIQLGEIVQANAPTPLAPTAVDAISATSKGDYTLTERYLDPQSFMIYVEFNPRDFEQYWRFAQPQGALLFRELDPAVQKTMLRLLLDQKDSYINDAIWGSVKGGASAKYPIPTGTVNGVADTKLTTFQLGGSTGAGPMKFFDGMVARCLTNLASAAAVTANTADEEQTKDAASGQVVLAGASWLSTGEAIESALYTMWQKTPARVRKNANLKFVMGWELWDKYEQYLTTKYAFKYGENPDSEKRRFKGKQIVVIDGIPEGCIFLGKFTTSQDSCLWMGIDYATDEESVKVERLQANSELYFMQMRLKMDVNIVRPSEIVMWCPYTKTA